MAELGPLARSVSCTVVMGVLVRLMTHFYLMLLLVLLSSAEGAVSAEEVGAEAVVDGAMGGGSVDVAWLLLELDLLD